MPKPRPTISSLMVLVFVVGVFLSLRRNPANLETLLVFSGLLVLGPFVLAPFRIHRVQWIAVRPLLVPIDPERDHPFAEEIRAAIADLTLLEFTPRQHYRQVNHVPNVEGFVSLFENARTLDVAKLICTRTVAARRVVCLVFCTEFVDGTEVLTSNSRTPTIWPKVGDRRHAMAFPNVRDTALLHEVHQATVRWLGVDVARRGPIGDPDAYLVASEMRQSAAQVGTGYYDVNESAPRYRPTWKGATLMSWKLLWPVRPIRLAWRRFLAARRLRQLGIR